MWCDDFDGDLYKLVPEARDVIAPAASVRLYTTGHTTHGQLNHPTCWNTEDGGLSCFLGFEEKPPQPPHYYSGNSLVACTFEEVMRDLWCHNVAAQVLIGDRYKPLLWGYVPHGYYVDEETGVGDVWWLYQALDDLLWHERKHRVLTGNQLGYRRGLVKRIMAKTSERILGMAHEHSLLKKDLPA